jgi:hypothetical protein
MFLKARCDLALMVAMLVELFFEEILRENACLWETINALLYFDINDTIIVGQVCEVFEFDEIGREVTEFHAHEFWLVLRCDEVEIFQINSAVAYIIL